MTPTVQLRFEVRDEWSNEKCEMVTRRILQQLWVDADSSVEEWKDVPEVQGWRDSHD